MHRDSTVSEAPEQGGFPDSTATVDDEELSIPAAPSHLEEFELSGSIDEFQHNDTLKYHTLRFTFQSSRAARSESVIISTSVLKVTVGVQPRSRSALVQSPSRCSTSEGRKYWGLTATRVRPSGPMPFSFSPSPSQVRGRSSAAEGRVAEIADGVGLAGGDHVVVGLFGLQHQPHGLDVVAGKTPVAAGVEVAEVQRSCWPCLIRAAAGDLAGHEGLAAARGLVVEQDAVDREHAVGLAVVAGDVKA